MVKKRTGSSVVTAVGNQSIVVSHRFVGALAVVEEKSVARVSEALQGECAKEGTAG